MKISVFGLGYIGLPTATMFAVHGAYVIGVDVNKYAVDTINEGRIHIIEPGLEEVVKKVVASGHLKAALAPEAAEAFLIAVPTPFKGDHEADLSYIKAATTALAPVLEKGNTVILESTSPVGATETMLAWLKEMRPDLVFATEDSEECDIYIAYCPERVLPGQVMHELIENDRIIGGINKASAEKAREVYRIFVKGELLVTNARTAEMSKLTENAFRDVNIAFANELSLICDRLDISVWELIELANHHPRVNILQPGPGVGGHCIAVDPWFLVGDFPSLTNIIKEAMKVNESMPEYVLEKIYNIMQEKNMTDLTRVGLYGLTYKENVDDYRDSPTLQLLECQKKHLAPPLKVYDPYIKDDIVENQYHDLDEFLDSVDLVVIMVKHNEISENEYKLKDKTVLDTVHVCREVEAYRI